jgi:cytochrome c oxidase subunit 3
MVSHFAHTHPGLDEKEPGTGGKPPVDHRPTGGGGGGGDDGSNDGVNPHALRDRIRITLALALTADTLVSVAFIAALQGRMAASPDPHAETHFSSLPPLLFLNTALLLLSCLFVEQARRQIFREIDALEEWLGLGKPALRRCLPWLAATLGLGCAFLFMQTLLSRFTLSAAPAGAQFHLLFSLTASIHGAHLALGMAGLLFCLLLASTLRRLELRQVVIDAVAWYWHAMGLVWVLLLVMISLGGREL